ncbi:MAG: glycosyltransferase family 2 protein [Planctomycetota bacterium]
MKIERVSLVIPVFNEAAMRSHLAGSMGRLQDCLRDSGRRAHFVFVDDGSTDGTALMLRELVSGLEEAEVVTHERNRGVGAAMRTGFGRARGEAVVCYDADCVYPVEDVLRLLDALDHCEVATATPFANAEDFSRQVPLGRRLLSRAASLAYRLALGPASEGVTTYTCAFRAYRADWLKGLRFRADGFLAAAEILVRAKLSGARVVEISSRLGERPAGVSKMKVVRTAMSHVGLLVRIAFERLLGRHRGRR